MKKRLFKAVAILMVLISYISCATPYLADVTESTEHEVVRVGIYDMEGFHSYDDHGDLSGYCIDYLNVVAAITGWEYEYVRVQDFADGCEKLEKHEIDLLAPAMMTDTRKMEYAYSELPFGTEYTILISNQKEDELHYEDYEAFNGMKVGVVKDYPLTEFFIDYMTTQGFQSELVYYNSVKNCRRALATGEVEAIVTSIMDMGENVKLLARFAPQPFYFITCKEHRNFLSELNSAMNRIQNTYPTLLDELLVTYYPIYETQFYTRDEVEFVENVRPLRVAYVDDRKPLSFKDEDGELNGISREIFDRIAELSGLQFEYVALPSGSITYDFLREQKIDLITGVEYNSTNMKATGIFMSSPYIHARKVLVSRPEFIYMEGHKYEVGIIGGSQTLKKVLNKNYPNLEIVEFETLADGFEALYQGRVHMFLQNQYVVEAVLTKPVYNNFSVISMEGLQDALCFSAVVSDETEGTLNEKERLLLIGVLNKTISQISETEIDDMVMRETLENPYKIELSDFLYNYRFTLTTLTCAFVILCILTGFYLREKQRREEILKEEARYSNLQQKRYKTIMESSDELIYEISMDGNPSIGSEKIKEKFGWEIPKTAMDLDFKKAMEILHIHPDDEKIFRQSQLANGEGKYDDLVMRIFKADGSYIWCKLSRTLLMDDNNNVVSILGKIVDVDEEVKEKKQLEHRSRTDSLTGLLNKITFEKEVRDYVEKNSTENASLIFLDMDHFKDVNDQFGHIVGDQVIKETAKKIQLLFANFDLVSRFGGDEFCIFVKEIPRDTLIDRLKFAVKKMEQEYPYEGGVVKVSASIGAAYCKKTDANFKELLDVADAAAYKAKDNGRNCYIIEDIEE